MLGCGVYGRRIWEVLGQFFLLINCLASSGYVIVCKPIRKIYPGLCVTAWSYMGAACMIAICATALTFSPFVMELLGCTMANDCSPWRVPAETIGPLVYWVFGNSILSYSLITWANAYAPASAVSCYTVLQPVVSAILCWILIAADPQTAEPPPPDGQGYGLNRPAPKDGFVLLIALGLVLVVWDAERTRRLEQSGAAATARTLARRRAPM